MTKEAKAVLTITKAASFAGRAIARLEAEAQAVHTAETERRDRSLHLVSTRDQVSALIRVGKLTIQVEGDDFAVTKSD
jgi:hypothetical protein